MRGRYVERLAGLDQDCGLRFSSTSWPIVSEFAEEPRQLPDVEKLDFRINHIIDRALDVRLQAD
jgi:hypothetical protein